MPIKDSFNKLKTSIIGTKTTDIDHKLDIAVKDIISYKSTQGRNSYIDLMKHMISKSSGSFQINNHMQNVQTPAAFGQAGRLSRYRSYDSIVNMINYCKRALDVLTDNILSPDDITKISLDVYSEELIEANAEIDTNVKDVEEVIKKIGLEDKLDIIVTNTLKLGDFFCEIGTSKTALTSNSSFLRESGNILFSENNSIEEFESEYILEGISPTGLPVEKEKKEVTFRIDYSSLDEYKNYINEDDNSDKKDKGSVNLNDICLLLYEPRRVIKLQSDMYPICLGYLIFPTLTVSPQLAVQQQAVNMICQQILDNVFKKIPTIKNVEVNKDDIKEIISYMLKNIDTKNINLRYIPPDRMVHFHEISTINYPYGESIFENVQFSAKVLIALETALTVQRLNRSTEKRKVSVDIGLPRDAKKFIESIKESLGKRKISLDSFGSVDTIPSMVSTFEDIYIPQKDGKSYVDIAGFTEGNVDIRNKVDELKFIRDQIVAGLGVPPSFVGIEENLSNKAALSEENILFARTVVAHQKPLTKCINELLQKVYNLIDPTKALTILDTVKVNLPSPKSLQYEREAKYTGDLVSLVQSLEGIGIPRDYSISKYLTNIDMAEVKQWQIDKKIDKSLKVNQGEDGGDSGGGLGMGGLGGF